MAETIDFLVVVLPTVIALLSVYVSIKLTKGEEHRVWWAVIIGFGDRHQCVDLGIAI